ncbi:helix-turn-helix domain-containing protein [Deinococcus gobiensis]|uniref:HTH cro/C1-type domain-containing protein n=1 Tax=Deinococcus gobiensis (strain DSM 21396 / JCM 16679 / CGMCC 1.7299 / I-0) TaxID=745776 RepID=H8H3V1_DEIGI|nr:hypothetical protein DGo_PE0054 [Deinococcus gobiensis I-0]
MPSVAITLKTARDRLGLTQKELAIQAFKDTDFQSLISRYEAGIVEPSIATLRRLVPVLGLSLGDFDEIRDADER